MSVFKCKMCGGDLEITEGMSVCECQYCGSKQTLPKLSDEKKKNLYDRAGHFRRNNEYDKAMAIYEQILNEDQEDAESYWSIVLCQYGIEYVEDPATHRRVPTVNRAQLTSIFSDENYKSALKYADSEQRAVYEAEAKEIEQIQKGILAISSKEDPFDVFICYKESDAAGRRTPDSVLANDLYHQLTQEGFKVFFARITLEDKLGSAYEPYIFAALNSAKVMVVLGTKPEYFTAVWVKNEWSRFLAQIKGGANKVLIPAYKDMDPYDLPEEFSHLQAQDMSKLGFMQDLIRGIKKLTGAEEKKETNYAATVEPVATANGAQALVERAFLFLEDGDFSRADELCEQALNQDPKNSQAYIGKLMVERKIKKQEDLSKGTETLTENNYFQKALRFAEDSLKQELERCNQMIMDRNKDFTYEEAFKMVKENGVQGGIQAAITVLESAIRKYQSLLGWKDSEAQIEVCKTKKTELLNQLYETTRESVEKHNDRKMDSLSVIKAMKEAIGNLEYLGNFQDSKKLLNTCQETKAFHEKKIRKKALRKIRIGITAAAMVALVVASIIFIPKAIRDSKYERALEYGEEGKYEKAIEILEGLDEKEYDTEEYIKEYSYKHTYELGIERMEAGDYENALVIFEEIRLFSDAERYIDVCKSEIQKEETYNTAMQYKEDGKYEDAIAVFTELEDYKDSKDQLVECKYQNALLFLKSEKYEIAMNKFNEIIDYKDSKEQTENCKEIIYQNALKHKEIEDYAVAISRFNLIMEYKDSANQVSECQNLRSMEAIYQRAVDYKSKEKYVDAIREFNNVSDYKDSDAQIETCLKLKDKNMIAVGRKHVVLVQTDGTVDVYADDYIVYDNLLIRHGENIDFGQWKVDDWENIIEVAAGYNHTVGLKSDGTVVAVGNNSSRQCNVGSWTDIIAIAAGNSHTVGLKRDGTVVACGWNNSGQCNVKTWTDIIAIAAGRQHTIGLKSDGTVVAVGDNEYGQCDVANWKNITAIAAGDFHTVGLNKSFVEAVGKNSSGQCNLSDGLVWWGGIDAIAAGRSHTVGMYDYSYDVVAVGSNEFGQCDAENFYSNSNKIIEIAAGYNTTAILDSAYKLHIYGD